MSRDQPSTTLVLPTPVTVNVGESKLALASKVLSWIAVIMLLLAMSIALINAAEERSQIREDVSQQTSELICRAKATDSLLQIITMRDNVLSTTVAAASEGDLSGAQEMLGELNALNAQVRQALSEHQLALIQCASS